MLKSILVDGTDVIDTGLEVKPGQEVSNMEIVLTNQITEVAGAVQKRQGDSRNRLRGSHRPHRHSVLGLAVAARPRRPTGSDGPVRDQGTPSMDSYVAVALDYLEPGEETNPEFLERMKALGSSLRLAEGEKKPLTLKISAQ